MNTTCTCVRCSACDGSGSYYVDMRGRFVSIHRQDDMGDMETCDTCRGSGINEMCEACSDAQYDEDF